MSLTLLAQGVMMFLMMSLAKANRLVKHFGTKYFLCDYQYIKEALPLAFSTETIAARIAESRKKLGLSQEELAQRLKTTRIVVAKWENATRDIKAHSIYALAEEFGVSADYLIGRTSVKSGDADAMAAERRFGLSHDAQKALCANAAFDMDERMNLISRLICNCPYEQLLGDSKELQDALRDEYAVQEDGEDMNIREKVERADKLAAATRERRIREWTLREDVVNYVQNALEEATKPTYYIKDREGEVGKR
jgi:transcriptional regulator with XRE-family HTH domain